MFRIWVDGSCKPQKISKNKYDKVGHSAIGIVIQNDNILVNKFSKYVGILNNNQAEYESLLFGIKYVLENNIKEVIFYTDSNLVQKQMNHQYGCYSDSIISYYEKAVSLSQLIPSFCVKWVSRNSNREADKMARKCLDDFFESQK